MFQNIKIALALFFIFNFSFVFGQNFFAETREIGMEDGLSHYKVLDFYPDQAGMWIATEEGLNFYDGYNWKYWSRDENQLNKNKINFIHKDQNDRLWLFSTKKTNQRKLVQSIDILSTGRDSVFSFDQKFKKNAPFQIKDIENFYEDSQQQIFFFAKNKLWKFTPSNLFQQVPLPQNFKPYTILSDDYLTGDINGKLGVVSPQGDLLSITDYSLNDEFYSIVGTHQKFWARQDRSSVEVFEKSSGRKYQSIPFPIQQKNKEFYFLFYDKIKKQVWVNRGHHTYVFDEDGNQLLSHEVPARVACMDKDNNLWTGKFNVTMLRPKVNKFKTYLTKNKKKHKKFYQCRGIFEKEGKLFVNTYDGIKIINIESGELLPSPPNLQINFDILKDHKGQLWTAYRKIYQLNKSENQISKTFKAIDEDPRIWSLFEDIDHRIWIGKIGLSYIENGELHEFQKYNEFKELLDAIVLFFYKDKNGIIWVGSTNGLFQLDPEKGIISGYGKNKKGAFQLPSSKFQHMHQDAQGIFWLTTEDAGLIKWNKATGEIQQFDKANGLLTNNIYSVYEDNFKNLWMSSFNGIVCFQKESEIFTIYNEEDGIGENEFNRISHFQSENGHIYFGSQNGVTSFHPNDFQKEKLKGNEFELSLSNVSIFGLNTRKDNFHDVSKIDMMNLGAGTKVIDFEITSPNMFWTNKVDLHYTLDPIGTYKKALPAFKEKISSDNHVELFGMHPGTYHLKVKAIQKNGKQLGETMLIPMKINKPFFHTTSFWILASLGTILIIWGSIKLRTTHLKKRQEELEKLVKERTEEIFKGQKIIQTQSEQIEAMKERLDKKNELWLEQFQSIVHERLDDPDLYLPDIIDKMEISRSIFYKKVKSLTQMTPNQYIQELRLSKAKNTLETGNVKTVKEVASSVGMKRPSYFSKLYKERFGILPSAYFNSHKN